MKAPHTFVIAEAGVNHNGSLERALEMVDVAADAGADAVKFQTFRAELLATRAARKADYQATNTREGGSQQDMLRRLELSEDDHRSILERCTRRGIGFMSTAFDAQSLAFLAGLGIAAVKMPSGDITCAPLLLQAARLRRPLIVSTGMATLGEIEAALGVVAFGLTRDGEPGSSREIEDAYCSAGGQEALRAHVMLLHCVTEYPAPADTVNLRAMDTMATAFGLPVGYSDHTLGIEVALAAVARGAVAIEKHFTLDRNLPGPDHAASIDPGELASLVRGIRTIESALGDGLKYPAAPEIRNRPVARRSLVAARAVRAGEPWTADALAAKRPGTGITPMAYWDILGRSAGRDYEPDELLDP